MDGAVYFGAANIAMSLGLGVMGSALAAKYEKSWLTISAGLLVTGAGLYGLGRAIELGFGDYAQGGSLAFIVVVGSFWLGGRWTQRSSGAAMAFASAASEGTKRRLGQGGHGVAIRDAVEIVPFKPDPRVPKLTEERNAAVTQAGNLARDLSKTNEKVQQLAAELIRAQDAKREIEATAGGFDKDLAQRDAEIVKWKEAASLASELGAASERRANAALIDVARLKKEVAVLKAKNEEGAALIELMESRRVEAGRRATDRRSEVLASFVRHLNEAAEYVHEGKRPRRYFREWCADVESEVRQHLSGAGVSWLQEEFLTTRNAAARFAAQSNETHDEEFLRYQYVLNNLKNDLEQAGEVCFRT